MLRETVHQALALVGLAEHANRGATQLSGGEQQRLALARAIVCQPSVLLLDEPLSNLDARLRERMRSEIRLLQRRLGITTVFVTHDQAEALSMSDRVAVMSSGRIVQEGTPREIYYEAQNEFVASFIGSTNLIYGETSGRVENGLVGMETSLGTVWCRPKSEQPPTASRVAIAVRPEDVKIRPRSDGPTDHSAINIYSGRIQVDLFGGTSTDYAVEVASGYVIRARVSSRMKLERGDVIELEIPPAACWLVQINGASQLE